MGDNMPYMLEKGGTLRLMERYLNKGGRKERLAYLAVVRQSEKHDDAKWFVGGPNGLWQEPLFEATPVPQGAPKWSGTKECDRLVRRWFGGQVDAAGHLAPLPAAKKPSTTGFWIAYEGDVHRIMRRSIRWALELSLGLGPDDPLYVPDERDPDGIDQRPAGRASPWPVELFWKCLAPWFEAWVVHRPTGGVDRGIVSVLLMTPTHEGANLAESPLAVGQNVQQGNGVGAPNNSPDYQVLGFDGAPGVVHATVAAVPPATRAYGTWVVTHTRQMKKPDPVIVNSAHDRDLADWGIAQLACYRGDGDIVVVSPSMAAGGVKHDGRVGP